jgi:hypothetical protein
LTRLAARPFAPGLARWRLSGRRRNDSRRRGHGPSVKRRTWTHRGSIADAAGLKGACAQPDPATDLATHRGSPADVLPPADAMTAADANACHGASVRRETCGPMPTHRDSPAGVSTTADAMTADDAKGPSVRREAGDGAGQPATECSLGRACNPGIGRALYYPR